MSEFSDRPFVAGMLTGLRAFRVDTLGRLTGVTYREVWTPGENAAACLKADDAEYYGRLINTGSIGGYSMSYGPTQIAGCNCPSCRGPIPTISPTAAKVVAAVKAEHSVASVGCQCGFYAYFDGGNDYLAGGGGAPAPVGGGIYMTYGTDDTAPRIGAIVNAWGTATVGTRGFRAEKAEVVALIVPEGTKARHEVAFSKVRRNYPGLDVFETEQEAVRAHPLTDPIPYSPETDPEFWTRSAS